jgi:hypothetical protein
MNRMVRNTYSNDMVLERLRREREKTMKAEAKIDKGHAPLWLKATLLVQSLAIAAVIFAFVSMFSFSLTIIVRVLSRMGGV